MEVFYALIHNNSKIVETDQMNIDTHSIQLNKSYMNKLINDFSQLNWLQLNEITYNDVMEDLANKESLMNLIIN